MKLFAFYLPQFHEIPENNEWWGDGFTEWTSIKSAVPLYPGHLIRHPLNGNYYNLLDKKTVEWQTRLMHSYHVDGMIYYHYYFKGKKLLEKPAENLLQWEDIDQPFFFCWANHNWYRSYQGSKELLIRQTYGIEEDWEQHFNYLLPFFKDPRYEKKDNKPMFMIFHPDFEEKSHIFDFFEKKCIENGFNGIYLIESYYVKEKWPGDYLSFKENLSGQTEKVFFREKNVSYRICRNSGRQIETTVLNAGDKKHVEVIDGNLLQKVIREEEPKEKDIIHGVFAGWDSTLRHGYWGNVITPPTKENFIKTMDYLADEEYVFYNAWNEWAEGMALEPSEEEGYKYLEWIKEWKEKTYICSEQ